MNPASRALLVEWVRELDWTVARGADAAGISRRTATKWLSRHQSHDPRSLYDRSSRPRRLSAATPIAWREMLREWAYAVAYLTSEARAKALSHWLRRYNKLRPHGSLDGQAPFSRLRPRVRTTS